MALDTNAERSTRHDSDTELQDVKERLTSEYTGTANLSEESVHRVVDDAAAKFADASVRNFVPILVERAARAQLSAPPASSV
jgi:hypothetical protein